MEQQNRQRGSALEPLDTSLLIARSVSLLEDLIDSFQDGGPQAVLPLYYKRWVHRYTATVDFTALDTILDLLLP